MKFATKASHSNNKRDGEEVISPLHLSTICAQKIPGEVKGFEYSRIDNPTRALVEEKIAFLEDAKHAILFSSGMAAITSVLSLLHAGDHMICSKNVYDGTKRVLDIVFKKFGVDVSFVTRSKIAEALKENTRLVWFESVSNPLLVIADIKAIRQQIKDCKLVIDSTFSTAFCVKPLELGADIVVQSTTKFLSGHHDTLSGVVLTNDNKMHEEIKTIQQTTGNMLAPFDCFLLSRGLKTLAVRMEKQCNNAMELAKQLEKHPRIEKVIFPGLPNHPNHEIAKAQMSAFGSMISIVLKGDSIDNFFKNLKIVEISQSLGGFSTIIQVPRRMMDLSESDKELDEMGITKNLIRISVGLEDVVDLIKDFNQALDRL